MGEEMSQQLFDVLGKLYRGQHTGCFISEECANNQAEDDRKDGQPVEDFHVNFEDMDIT